METEVRVPRFVKVRVLQNLGELAKEEKYNTRETNRSSVSDLECNLPYTIFFTNTFPILNLRSS